MKPTAWALAVCAMVFAGCSLASNAQEPAAPVLHALFQDHAVLQRDHPLPVWGAAAPGVTVHVQLAGQAASTRADDAGHWQVTLKPIAAGGPYTLSVRVGDLSRSVHDVLVGDVWLCAGQSNMELPVWRTLDAPNEIASATQPTIRLFTVPKAAAVSAQRDLPASAAWRVTSPESVRDFSAACFYFARELQKSEDVPMGLVQAAWGGSRIEAWTSAEALHRQGGLEPALQVLALHAHDPAAATAQWGLHWQQWWSQRAARPAADTPWRAAVDENGWHLAPKALGAWEHWGVPSLHGYNGMVWYRTQVTLTAAQAGQGATLELGPVDETDMTWVNGVAVGSEYGAGERRRYALPAGLLKAGANAVVINVLDTYADGGLSGPAAAHAVRLDDGTRIALDAGWQYRVARGEEAPPMAPWHAATGLSTLYNGMIAPLGSYALRGTLWYQGESNTGDAATYAGRLRSLRDDWRARFGTRMPLLLVQLAGYGAPPQAPVESGWAQVREAQRRVAAEDRHTGLAIAIDLGDVYDIHPPNKQELGRRLARVARQVVLGERNLAASGPAPRKASATQGGVRIGFDGVAGALVTTGANGPIGFEVCDADARHCQYADAVVDGHDVVLRWPLAGVGDRVRYCWADGPVCTLRDRRGAPAGPFELSIPPAEVP